MPSQKNCLCSLIIESKVYQSTLATIASLSSYGYVNVPLLSLAAYALYTNCPKALRECPLAHSSACSLQWHVLCADCLPRPLFSYGNFSKPFTFSIVNKASSKLTRLWSAWENCQQAQIFFVYVKSEEIFREWKAWGNPGPRVLIKGSSCMPAAPLPAYFLLVIQACILPSPMVNLASSKLLLLWSVWGNCQPPIFNGDLVHPRNSPIVNSASWELPQLLRAWGNCQQVQSFLGYEECEEIVTLRVFGYRCFDIGV